MKATELRIGNLVNYNHMSDDDAITIEIKNLSIDSNLNNFRPIPLTEEWLLNFGFKKGVKGWFKTLSNNCKFNLYMHSKETYKYVHKLQNLYFALTNEELKTTL